MTRHDLRTEKLAVLPKRHETSFFALGNVNVALVGQSNSSTQLMGIGVIAAQGSQQSNTAIVLQHN